MEDCARDYKKKMHKATKASVDALNFRAKFDDSDSVQLEGRTLETTENGVGVNRSESEE